MAVEEPKFKVITTDGSFTLREYPPLLVAETLVENSFDAATDEGFRRLANYIFGANQGDKKVAMTAPVTQSLDSGQKISMISPVGLQKDSDKRWKITFTMPSEFTLATLPKPNDKRVIIQEIPPQLIAVNKYSGTWSQERFEERKRELLEWIHKNALKPLGEPVFARYNPPWIPWFMRRNEVLITVEKAL